MTVTSREPEAKVSQDLRVYRTRTGDGATRLWPARDDVDAVLQAAEFFRDRPGVTLYSPDGSVLARSPGWRVDE